MKLLFLFLTLFFIQTPIFSQTLPAWHRVYTFDDKSIVELNTNYVMFSNYHVERVRFRWTYDQIQPLGKDSKVQYKSIVQEIAFDCKNERYSVYETEWFDADGKQIPTQKTKSSAEMKKVSSSKTIGNLFKPACNLIELRRREPPLEQ